MEATILAQEFQRRYKNQYNQYPFSMKTVKEGKWWPHFQSFCDNSTLENGKEAEFIQRLFDSWEENNKLYPYVLSQEQAKMIERRMKENVETESLSENDYINLTLRKANTWAIKNRIYNNKLGNFLNNPTCQLLALRGEYYKPLFFFCRSFLNKYKLSEDDVLKKNSIRAFHKDLYEALKRALTENFVD